MEKMPQNQSGLMPPRVAPGSQSCILRADRLATWYGGRAARRDTSQPRALTSGRLGNYGEV